MSFRVEFLARDGFGREVVATVHRIPSDGLAAYRASPAIALAAVRSVRGSEATIGLRILDDTGTPILKYIDRRAALLEEPQPGSAERLIGIAVAATAAAAGSAPMQ